MTGIIDYTRTETHFFTDLPFNEIDTLIISTLIHEDVASIYPTLMLDEVRSGSFAARVHAFEPKHPLVWLKGIRHPKFESVSLDRANRELHRSPETHADDKPHEAQMISVVNPGLIHSLFQAAGENPRYTNVRLDTAVEHINQGGQAQFATATLQLPNGHKHRKPTYKDTLVISFRGTDGSLIEWREDFNTTFQYPVPAQCSTSVYLDTVARLWEGPIILVSHSKGGNLAIYAAVSADPKMRKRIQRVHSLDSPDFPPGIVTSPAYRTIQPKVMRIVPSSSIVGMISETPEPCHVVSSDSGGIMQHSALTWLLDGDRFITEPGLSSSSQLFSGKLNYWIATLTPGQHKRVVGVLFTVLHTNSAASFSEIMSNLPASIPAMLGAYVGLTPADRCHLVGALAILFKASTAKHKPTPAPASVPSSTTSEAAVETPAEIAAGADNAAPARTDADADTGTTASPSAEDATEIIDQLIDISTNNGYAAQ